MEHLADGVISCLPRVPYIVEHPYDMKGFHTFPRRAGWYMTESGLWKSYGNTRGGIRPGPLGSVAAFLQAWLFFGLLTEVLGADAQIKLVAFKEQDDHGHWNITTKGLPNYLREWKERELKSTSNRHSRITQAQLALDEAYNLISRYCSVSGPNQNPCWDIDEMLVISFMILGETLSNAKTIILEEGHLRMHGWYNGCAKGWGDSRAVLRALRSDKWCPRFVHVLPQLLDHSVSGLVYMLHLSHAKALELDHSKCSIEECKARETATWKTTCRLTSQLCQCDYIGPSMSELIRIIGDGKIAILQYHHESQHVDVIEHKHGMRYTILSHVWADGMSNSNENKLRLCQLESLTEVFERLRRAEQALHAGNAPSRLETSFLFWIDTLAIPIGQSFRSERQKAIMSIYQTYKRATCTIVLDAGLMSQYSGGTYAESAMKITTSHWMTRLWTLQEAFLSKRLFFNFANALIDMDTLECMHRDYLSSTVPLAAQSYHQALLGPERENRKIEDRQLISSKLIASLWKAVQWRQTNYLQHETLALASILQLSVDSFDELGVDMANQPTSNKANLDKKMQTLLSLVSTASNHAIPAGIIFLPGQKLREEGYRWAPKTWMTGQTADYMDSSMSSIPGAQLTKVGLLFRYPGYRLYNTNFAHRETDDHHGTAFPYDSSLRNWLVITSGDGFPFVQSVNIHDLAVITMNQRVGSNRQIALLVAIHDTRGDTIYVQTVKRVWIRTETDITRIKDFQNVFKQAISSAPLAESLNPDPQWCLDGSEEQYLDDDTDNSSIYSFISTSLSFYRSFDWKNPSALSVKSKVLT